MIIANIGCTHNMKKPSKQQISEVMRFVSSKATSAGRSKAGTASWEALTPEQRTARAKKAAAASAAVRSAKAKAKRGDPAQPETSQS